MPLTKGIYNKNNKKITLKGKWGSFIKNNLEYIYSETPGDTLSFIFNGTGCKILTHYNAWRGIANLYIDNVKHEIDCYAKAEAEGVLYEVDNLEMEEHKVVLEVSGNKNNLSVACKVAFREVEISGEIEGDIENTEEVFEIAKLKEELVVVNNILNKKEEEIATLIRQLAEKEEIVALRLADLNAAIKELKEVI